MIHFIEQHEKCFTVYSNRFATSTALSLSARAVLRYLLAKPDTWIVCKNALKKALGVGRCVVDRVIKELVTAGYLLPRSGTYVVLEDLSLAQEAGERGSGIVRLEQGAREGRFSVTDNEPFVSQYLSLAARGLLCYLLTLPKSWDVSVTKVATANKLPYRQMVSAFRELEKHGHSRRTPRRRADGKVCGWQIDIYEYRADIPTDGITVDRPSENQHLVKTNNTLKTDINKEPLNPQQGGQGSISQSAVSREDFEVLVAAYPKHRRGCVDDAFGEYQQALSSDPDTPDLKSLADVAARLSRSDQWQADGGKYVPSLVNWIRGRKWWDICTVPEPVPVEDVDSPSAAAAIAYAKDTLTRRLLQFGPDPTPQQRFDALSSLETYAWVQFVLSGGHPRFLAACSLTLDRNLIQFPDLEEYLDKHFPFVLTDVAEYREENRVPTAG